MIMEIIECLSYYIALIIKISHGLIVQISIFLINTVIIVMKCASWLLSGLIAYNNNACCLTQILLDHFHIESQNTSALSRTNLA